MILIINYDLKKPGQDYSGLYTKIKSLGSWAHPCDSCWLVRTNKSASLVSDTLRSFIDANDSLLVSRFDDREYAGWLSKDIWSWIKSSNSSARTLSL